jgi:hypothetical protein
MDAFETRGSVADRRKIHAASMLYDTRKKRYEEEALSPICNRSRSFTKGKEIFANIY